MKQTEELLLPYNIQFFAEGEETPESAEETKEEDTTAETKNEAEPEVDIQALLVKVASLERKADKAASEAAEYKKKYKQTLSEKEQYDLEAAEKQAAHDAEFEAMKEKVAVSELKEQFVSIGYSLEQAQTAAKAQYEGDTETLLKVQGKFVKEKIEAEKQKILSEIPQPNIGVGGAKTYTKEDFDKMTLIEKTQLKRENEAEYERLLKL